jgi:hypothetical protein
MALLQDLVDKISELPPDKVAEVRDFVDFLHQRSQDRQLVKASTQLSEAAFERVWNNPDDAEYDQL